jgi:hypothetical protein
MEMTLPNAMQIEQFWNWFIDVSDGLIAGIEKEACMWRLDERLRALHPGLRWEICAGVSRARQLTISPNLDPELRATAQEIVFAAPVLANWEYCSARQPKEWDYKIHLPGHGPRPVELDATNWVFILLGSPDGGYYMLLSDPNLPLLTEAQRRQAAADVLCNLLGEELVIETIRDFELVYNFHHYLAQRASPIHLLPAAIESVQGCKTQVSTARQRT